jgi:diaminohydroxyphosphoribosylaminopyrimidine deaminase/5-amino-6-(5-phosphoribosylamino)uracil reductase
VQRLFDAGCEVLVLPAATPSERLQQLLAELGRRRMTNILVEGGSELLGGLFDAGEIDEVHAFIAPKLFGGARAPAPIGGEGIGHVVAARHLSNPCIAILGSDVYLSGRLSR